MHGLDELPRKIGGNRILELPNRRHAPRSRYQAFVRTIDVDAANRDHRDSQRPRYLAQFFDALRRSKLTLRRRIEDWPEKHVVRARCFGSARIVETMARNSDHKFFRRASIAAPTNRFPHRYRGVTQMHSERALRNGDIEPVIHYHSRAPARNAPRYINRIAHEP